MADEVAEELEDDEQGGGAKPSGRKKLVLFGVIGLAVLVAVGAGVFFLWPSGGAGHQVAESGPAKPDPVYFYDLPELTVNLSTIDDRTAYLKMRIALELSDESVAKKIEPYLPRILDTFQVYLRELRTTDLRGSSGLFRLKEELQRRINIAVYPAKVNNVLFKQLLIQ